MSLVAGSQTVAEQGAQLTCRLPVQKPEVLMPRKQTRPALHASCPKNGVARKKNSVATSSLHKAHWTQPLERI